MIDVPVYNMEGKQTDTVQMDAARFGGHVRPALLKQAVVMYQANQRQGTAAGVRPTGLGAPGDRRDAEPL